MRQLALEIETGSQVVAVPDLDLGALPGSDREHITHARFVDRRSFIGRQWRRQPRLHVARSRAFGKNENSVSRHGRMIGGNRCLRYATAAALAHFRSGISSPSEKRRPQTNT